MRRVICPLPDRDFDVTEVSVPWRLLTDAGIEVVFATESGETPAADPLLLSGVIFGQLGADPEPKQFYEQMSTDERFTSPLAWSTLSSFDDFDGLLLPGGHAQGMRQYLASEQLQRHVASFWRTEKPVAAICHGVLVLARSVDPESGRSILHGARTTCLPKYMERSAYWLTAWKLGRYYRTYPAYVQDEVKEALEDAKAQFVRGPIHLMARGSRTDHRAAFVVEDGRYVSGRWPGDAYLLAERFIERLHGAAHTETPE
ncbi:MAG: type 1 glutamine amidotransferase domain-containing protein [Bradymonadia bacterium]